MSTKKSDHHLRTAGIKTELCSIPRTIHGGAEMLNGIAKVQGNAYSNCGIMYGKGMSSLVIDQLRTNSCNFILF